MKFVKANGVVIHLYLVGYEDGSTPVALAKETAALIPASRFEIVEGAGHLANVEKPKVVAGLVCGHARRGRPSRRDLVRRAFTGAPRTVAES
jgi:hypothetical protein